MYLCDYLGSASITHDGIQRIKTIGEIVEIKATALRDCGTYVKGLENDQPNLLSFWLKTSSSTSPDKFLSEIDSIVESKLTGVSAYRDKTN